MNPIRAFAGLLPANSNEANTTLPIWNGAIEMQLIHEALSRARMPRPQAGSTTTRTEATRSARTVAVDSRHRAARELGTR